VLLNAGAACYVAGLAKDLREGIRLSADVIDRGAARETLARLVATSQRLGTAEAAPA